MITKVLYRLERFIVYFNFTLFEQRTQQSFAPPAYPEGHGKLKVLISFRIGSHAFNVSPYSPIDASAIIVYIYIKESS